MTEQVVGRRSAQVTRRRILDAALRRLSRHSYEATTLRDIAADVGIDVALVHRSFGSKEELFKEVIRTGLDRDFRRAVEAPDPVAAVAAHILRSRGGTDAKRLDLLDIVAHSLGSDRAAPVLREVMQRDFIEPLSRRIGSEDALRPTLAMACLTGVAILADVLGLPVLREAAAEDILPALETLIHACLGSRGPSQSA